LSPVEAVDQGRKGSTSAEENARHAVVE